MGVGVQVRLLGQVDIFAGGRPVGAGPPQQQLVVAALAMDANRVVPVDTLLARVWDAPPDQARRTLYVHIARIRRALESAAAGGTQAVKVLRGTAGYRLTVAPERVDALRFRALLAAARRPGLDDRTRTGLLHEVLGVWRGQPLAGLSGRWAADIRTALTGEYLDAVVAWADTELRGGNPSAVVGMVSELAGEHLLVESLAAVMMRALCALGRSAEALVHYERVRERIAESLGADPGPQLQSMYLAILRGSTDPASPAVTATDPRGRDARPTGRDGNGHAARRPDSSTATLSPVVLSPTALAPPSAQRHAGAGDRVDDRATDHPAGTAAGTATSTAADTTASTATSTTASTTTGTTASTATGAAAAPARADRTLPADVSGFVGRQDELERLLAATARASGTIAIHAVDGMAGVGKSAFAIHAAHRLAERFPDGQRFVALRAHAPGQSPVDPAAALETLLQADGVPAADIPAGLDARAALWRDRMAGKRMLLLFDDAADAGHVTPLLPAAPGYLALVTSRRMLATLPGAAVISLDTLPPDQAVRLFLGRAGRGPDEAGAAARIVELCGYLPLAIALAAARLHTHPAWSVHDLVEELGVARDRLAELASGDMAVSAALDLSYRDLPARRQRLLRRLGLHPGPDFDVHAAAALDGVSVAEARRGMEDLLEHHLVQEPRRGRYRFHDLIALRARAMAARDPDRERHESLGRLVSFYLRTATRAATLLPREMPPLSGDHPPEPALDLNTPRAAAHWLALEQANLAATAGWAAGQRDPAAVGIPVALHEHLRVRRQWAFARDLHRAALGSASDAGDRAGQALALLHLADARRLLGDVRDAIATAERALELYQRLGDRYGEAAARYVLGGVRRLAGDGPAALAMAGRSLELYRQLNDPYGQAAAWIALSRAQLATGAGEQAAASAERALELYLRLDDSYGRASTMALLVALLSEVYPHRGEHHAEAARTALGLLQQDAGMRDGRSSPRRGPGMAPVVVPPRPAPPVPYEVRVRRVTLARGDRRLPVTIWYPEPAGSAPDGEGDAFPVVLFSHGLNATPSGYGRLLARWAAAGFIVVAPTYPSLGGGAAEFNLFDAVNYPADASAVLTHVLALGESASDPLYGRVDAGRVAAAGHSLGGITTIGLLSRGRDDRLVAGVVLAGDDLGYGGGFDGAPAPLLFVHGDSDPLISHASSRRTFERAPWPKAFLTLHGGNHHDPYADPADPSFATVAATTTEFLRLSLYGDRAARTRFSASVRQDDSAVLDDRL